MDLFFFLYASSLRQLILQMKLHMKIICMIVRDLRLHLTYRNVKTESEIFQTYDSSDIRYLSAHSLFFCSFINNKFRSTILSFYNKISLTSLIESF